MSSGGPVAAPAGSCEDPLHKQVEKRLRATFVMYRDDRIHEDVWIDAGASLPP